MKTFLFIVAMAKCDYKSRSARYRYVSQVLINPYAHYRASALRRITELP